MGAWSPRRSGRAASRPGPGPRTRRGTSRGHLLTGGVRCRLSGRGGERVAELLVHQPEPFELGQGLQRGPFVEPLDGEPDVHDHVVADPDVRQVLQADVLADAAEVDLGHQRVVAFLKADDPARYREAHGQSPSVRAALVRAAETTSWPRASPPSFGGTRRCRSTVKPSDRSAEAAPASSSALPNTPPERATVSRPCAARARRASSTTRSTTAAWNRAPATPAGTPARRSATSARSTGAASARSGSSSWIANAYVPSAGTPRARLSSSIAAWASKSTVCRTPSRELTASNSRPMLEVGAQPSPVASWWASAARSTGGHAATGGRSASHGMPAACRWASAIRYGRSTVASPPGSGT